MSALNQFQRVLKETQVMVPAQPSVSLEEGLRCALSILQRAQRESSDVYLIGNGGSAALVAHVHNDLVNKARVRAHVLHEPSLLTCMSNDYGYENAYALLAERYLKPRDVLIAVSSSGASKNILAAVDVAMSREADVITLSGFSPDNPLQSKGTVNVWLPSADYGEVEVGHQFVLHYLSDALADAK
ncbi:SIS domain-containing protein [Paraburkholderia steynii]|uniref:SIS domain-containing protein n=1 Tax=Paraburkholderia steynii TaxID=1245441 RepID=UPI00141DD707|nr:SIS domain-containing protein [Paraburkholderia steynii]